MEMWSLSGEQGSGCLPVWPWTLDMAMTPSTRPTCLSIRVAPWYEGLGHVLMSGIRGIKKDRGCKCVCERESHGLRSGDGPGFWAPLQQPSPGSDGLLLC